MVPQKVETGDSVKMKQVMDDAVVKAVRCRTKRLQLALC